MGQRVFLGTRMVPIIVLTPRIRLLGVDDPCLR